MENVTRDREQREQRDTRTYRIADREYQVVERAAEAFGLPPSTFVRAAAIATAKLAAEEGVGQTGNGPAARER